MVVALLFRGVFWFWFLFLFACFSEQFLNFVIALKPSELKTFTSLSPLCCDTLAYGMYVHFSPITDQNNSCFSLCLVDFGGGTHNYGQRPYGFWFPPENSEEDMRRRRLRRFDR